jgi:hypothetical protein
MNILLYIAKYTMNFSSNQLNLHCSLCESGTEMCRTVRKCAERYGNVALIIHVITRNTRHTPIYGNDRATQGWITTCQLCYLTSNQVNWSRGIVAEEWACIKKRSCARLMVSIWRRSDVVRNTRYFCVNNKKRINVFRWLKIQEWKYNFVDLPSI